MVIYNVICFPVIIKQIVLIVNAVQVEVSLGEDLPQVPINPITCHPQLIL